MYVKLVAILSYHHDYYNYNSTVLGSGIVSSALQCGNQSCSMEEMEASNLLVRICIQQSENMTVNIIFDFTP